VKAKPIKGEGWDVFMSSGSSDGPMQICVIDSPDTVNGKEVDAQIEPAFADDEEAIRHVLGLAERGDKQALEALWMTLPYDGLLNRVLWCEAMGWNGPRAAAFPKGFALKWGLHLDTEEDV
jgi:hypothetical protein